MEDRSDRLGRLLNVSDKFLISSIHADLDIRILVSIGSETRWNNCSYHIIFFVYGEWVLHSIPRREKLSYRGIEVQLILCLVCSLAGESIDHLFISYLDFI